MVMQTNPGLIAYIRMQNPEPTFQRFMVSFDAQKDEFMARCRPFVCLDGCHLNRPYKGVLLFAVTLDANNALYPLAVCICEVENYSSWRWFLGHLMKYLNYPNDKPITFISDLQKGSAEDHYCLLAECFNQVIIYLFFYSILFYIVFG
ncbi:hypothetical protein ACOSQ3_012837 [Xanthoceras sorbifolium]